MHFAALLHASFETPARIADWAARHGHRLDLVPLHEGAPLPDAAALDGLVVMGGPMNIYQYRDHPWLKAEAAFVEKALGLGKKTVGVCLGAQLLADVLGARVVQNPEREVGWLPVAFSPEARTRFPFLPEAQTVLHWHGDTFGLPEGAVRLASSAGCAEQAFLFEEKALGLQFHLEIAEEDLAELIRNDDPAAIPPGRYVQEAKEICRLADLHAGAANDLLDALLGSFFA